MEFGQAARASSSAAGESIYDRIGCAGDHSADACGPRRRSVPGGPRARTVGSAEHIDSSRLVSMNSMLNAALALGMTLVTAADPLATLPATKHANSHGCLDTGDGYLRVHIRGALQLDVSLRNAELECDGGPRPDGSGIRVSFAGPARSDGRRLRMVFGIAKATEGAAGRELATNLTVIFEGEQRMFATRGDGGGAGGGGGRGRGGARGGPSRAGRG